LPETNIRTQLLFVLDAADFAARKHSTQRRKDAHASPYINHPLALARILADTGKIAEPVILAASLLHDTMEDTQTSHDELRQRFGAEVADIVQEVTDDKTLEKPERKRLQVEAAAKKSRGAKLVKLADKISNLRDIIASPPVDWPLERKIDYFNWASDVVAGLRGTNQALEDEFDRVFELGMRVFDETAV
jgi:GTP diphosphokinase / guanosine-3',5'-bis(diphosphate) 3'-diphosphatase